ncbi:hypothetical protein OPT61_g6573 [Boeremia exigua]|uniref:Uncharacterized protein n=1 Tax=Boeremia exigua TaxID=749465 RepID=A0ACC2I5Z0_9PLEO|nr:hypothetical protein OPT61_g6573 [Boeremia exigua]
MRTTDPSSAADEHDTRLPKFFEPAIAVRRSALIDAVRTLAEGPRDAAAWSNSQSAVTFPRRPILSWALRGHVSMANKPPTLRQFFSPTAQISFLHCAAAQSLSNAFGALPTCTLPPTYISHLVTQISMNPPYTPGWRGGASTACTRATTSAS